ncbi:hypothetical protein KEM48_008801 [Puccinia striiformis f. sp. tritici PST-130]|nr:hypothetical protein KEM48_008801 [Puccinia striiformis f. sp. tritici PST-130]
MVFSGFEALPRGDGPQKYRCLICDGRRTCLASSMDSHKSARHRTKLAQLNAFYQMTAAGLGGSTHQNRPDQQSPPGGPPSDIDIEDNYIPAEQDDESLSEDDDDQGIDPGQFGYRPDESDSESDGRSDEEDWSWSGEQTLGEDFEPNEQDIPTTGSTSRPQRTRRVPASSPWYPFPSLDHLIGSLILGQLHSIMSRNLYNHLQVILTLRHVNLPHWDTLRRMRSRMRSMLKMEPSENQSVLLNKTFTLNVQSIVGNELANPIPKGGLRANAPAGSRQFDLHLPSMIPWFHPDLIEIPVDQFQKTYSELTTYYGDSYVELCGNRFIACGSGLQRVDIPIPNPWRVRAGGKIIRHVPVTLYADDTSGNKSKRWNKHAGPLEIGEPIIDEINKMSQEGCVAYDALLEEEVLMVVVPLCFLADSPMAAEVTNTPNPGSSNNPSSRTPPLVRNSTRTEELWISSQTDTVKEQERKLQLYGLRDRISLELAERKRDNLEERLRIIQLEDQTPHRKKIPRKNDQFQQISLPAWTQGPQPSTADIPEVLRQHYPNREIMMISALNLNEKNTIRPGSFVLCIKIGIQQENSMTIISKEGRYVYVPVEQIICTLNVQHDCFSGNCPTFQTTLAPVGRQEGTTVTQQLLHTNNNRYLLNAYSHHVAECHRNHSEITVGTIPESMKILACRQGLYKWEQEKDS